MLKQLKKMGMAIAVPFTMAASVAMAQCPTINSLNLSIGLDGQMNFTANMSASSYNGTFAYRYYRVGDIITTAFPSPTSNYSLSINTGSIQTMSNGEYTFEIAYYDASSTCSVSVTSGGFTVLNKIDPTSSCPKIQSVDIDMSSFGGNIKTDYTGTVSSMHDILLSLPIGYSHTEISKGYFSISSTSTMSPSSYTLTLVDPTNTICPSDVITSSQTTPSCSANSAFVISPDAITQGVYNLLNYSTSTGTTSYLWDFGDGSTSTLAYPTHTYSAAGFYTVCLTVTSSDGCYDTQCMLGGFKVSAAGLMTKIVVKNPNAITGIDEQELVSTLLAYPNPVLDELTIEINENNTTTLVYSITDALGKVVNQNKLMDAKTVINTSSFNNGFYLLNILNEKGNVIKTTKLVK